MFLELMTAAAAAIQPIELEPVVTVGGQVIYALQPKQLLAYRHTPVYDRDDGKRHIGYGGSAGSAKSHTARAVAVAVAAYWPGSTSIIFRQTEKEVLENHYQKFLFELPTHVRGADGRGRVPFYTWNGQDKAFTFPHLGRSRILLGHLGHEGDVTKYQGNEYDLIIFEESTHYTWTMVSWLIGNRLRATVPKSLPFAFYPTNPGNVGHQWYTRLFIRRDFHPDENPDQHVFVQAKLADNAILRGRDPQYELALNRLAEPYRSWLRDGDFEAGAGSALPQLRRGIHLVQPFAIPDHWEMFGGFDWGFAHRWAFGLYASNEDGDLFKVATITGQYEMPDTIAQRIKIGCGDHWERLKYIDAGHDVFQERKARGENLRADNVPTLHEQFMEEDRRFRIMRRANVARVLGLQNLRAYLQWDNTGPVVDGQVLPGDPGLRLFDNAGNQMAFEQLAAMVPDPDNPEDVRKVDADAFGEGGDDIYDETRMAVAGRPKRAVALEHRRPVRAFDPAMLQLEMDRGRKGDDVREKLPKRPARNIPMHPEQGDYL